MSMNNATPEVALGRYDVPTDPDKDSVDKRSEVPETRPDLASEESAAGAAANVDSVYAGLVSKYFREQRAVEAKTDAADTKDFDRDALLASEQQTLEKLANPDTARLMQPRDSAIVLADLAGEMAAPKPELEAGQTRKVFMESCRKVYPHVDSKRTDFAGTLRETAERLQANADTNLVPDLATVDLNALLEKDPRAAAKLVDQFLRFTGERMQMEARIGFDTKEEKDITYTSGELTPAVEAFYKLQLLRDDLRRRTYGRADATPTEEKKIDAIRRDEFGLDTGDNSPN
jgi:hypothetical protein